MSTRIPPLPMMDVAARERERRLANVRTKITSLPPMSDHLHQLPYFTPASCAPHIARGAVPRLDEGVRESMVSDQPVLESVAERPTDLFILP